ncbi:hypothetical protein CDAR_75931 [Caerostris darwini]|uniref:Uncharacterized protein n=1 Tax=Caerostris darwini TaxID=1538125 RepID=A0AAV4P0R8_9ARAC|nr:hypothetical protein CDAR_75931 [Caerostris darwini]
MIKHTKSQHNGMIQFWPRLQKNRPQEKCYLSNRFCHTSLLNGWNSQTGAIKKVADNTQWPLRGWWTNEAYFSLQGTVNHLGVESGQRTMHVCMEDPLCFEGSQY